MMEDLGQVVDFNEVRQKKLSEKKRKTERYFFKSLIQAYSVLPETKLLPIEMGDFSEDGCSFKTETKSFFPRGDLIPIRLYFSTDTYLEILIKVINSRLMIENGKKLTRVGCIIDKEIQSYSAYQAFVQFIRLYSESAHRNVGEKSLFYK